MHLQHPPNVHSSNCRTTTTNCGKLHRAACAQNVRAQHVCSPTMPAAQAGCWLMPSDNAAPTTELPAWPPTLRKTSQAPGCACQQMLAPAQCAWAGNNSNNTLHDGHPKQPQQQSAAALKADACHFCLSEHLHWGNRHLRPYVCGLWNPDTSHPWG
jgi:hypothetical protein